MSQTVTHKDLARKLRVSETTIKSYRRKFEDCIPMASHGKPIRFLPEAVAVCTRIRDLFDLGMSVEEVRARLADEFPWISLIKKEVVQPQVMAGVPQDFTIALSNLAKSMVTIIQQQNGVMDRMKKLETVVQDIGTLFPSSGGGLKTADFKAVLEDLQAYLRNALMPLQQLQRLNDIQSVADVLHQAANNMADTAQTLRSIVDKAKAIPTEMEPSSKVVQFSRVASPQQLIQMGQAVLQDPPRAFLLRPMVVRTMEGAYISAGGKSRGRFTLNDFKALLVYGRKPGEHFPLYWEQAENDWIANLIHPGGESVGKWRLQFKEAVSKSGVGVVELTGFTGKGQNLHPAEFCSFVSSLINAS